MTFPAIQSYSFAARGKLKIAYLSPVEINALTTSFQNWYDSSSGKGVQRRTRGRYWVTYIVLRFTGARLGEVLLLDDKVDIDTRTSDFRLPTLKRRADPPPKRIVPVPPSVMTEIAAYLLDWPDMRGQIFRLDSSNFRKEFMARAKEAGILKRYQTETGQTNFFPHPHSLRHSRAIELLSAGVPVTAVQDLLGHSSLLTTVEYLKLSGQDIKNILRDKELI